MKKPPPLFVGFFRWFCRPDLVDHIEGDLFEIYAERYRRKGKRAADLRFSKDVLLLFRPGIWRPWRSRQTINLTDMIKNYFKIGWRNLVRNKGYAAINIGGLAAGMAVALLIGLWIYDEISFNKYHSTYARVAQVMVNGHNTSGGYTQWAASPPIAREIRDLYGNDFRHVLMTSRNQRAILTSGGQKIIRKGFFAESGMAEMLALHILQGTGSQWKNMNSVLLSASTAKALFGTDDPIGKSVKIDANQETIVVGVYEDVPDNSEFNNMEFVSTWELYVATRPWIRVDDWRQNGFLCYAEIKDGEDFAALSMKIKNVKLKHVDDVEAKNEPQVFLFPMSRWRLHGNFDYGVNTGGRIEQINLFGMIGIFVLLLACINFMNLSTARSEKRAKETGIRKTVGSNRGQLIGQFFVESILVATIAFAIAVLAALLGMPLFNDVAGKHIALPWSAPVFWILGIGFTLITGILAGSYPALYLSSFQPVNVLKGALRAGRFASLPRKVLVVLQFTISVCLVIGVIIVFKQVEFGKHRDVGYDRRNLLWVNTATDEIHRHIDAVRHELKQSGMVTEIAESLNSVTTVAFTIGGYDWTGNGPNTDLAFGTVWSSPEYGKTAGWQFIAGRDFSREIASDTASMILNETAASVMNLGDPIGKTVHLTMFDRRTTYKIVGVIKDMLMESPYEPVRKTVYLVDNSAHNLVNIRVRAEADTREALRLIESVFLKFDPASPFEYKFVDEAYALKFAEEERLGKLAMLFAGFAIFISALGILGLASFIAEQKTKEIGIRKVMGASVLNLWGMLSSEFVRLVFVSCVIAVPLSYYFMNDWLQQFGFRTEMHWSVFLFASLGALTITLLTVSYQALKAAVVNPVNSLRSE